MGAPLCLVENLLDRIVQFPLHVVEVDETEADGHEIDLVADGRRSPFDFYTATTANHLRTVKITCDTARAVNTMFLDRGHNLGGVAGFKLDWSTDGTSWTNVWNITIPTTVGTDLTATNGCTTSEGAWGKVWTPAAATVYHRITFPALGAGIKPVVVGLWLGTAYEPTYFFNPWAEDRSSLLVQEDVSTRGWKGRGPAVDARVGDFGIQADTDALYTTARYHLKTLYGAGHPMWICFDRSQADRSFLAVRPAGGVYDFPKLGVSRTARIPYEEWEPKAP